MTTKNKIIMTDKEVENAIIEFARECDADSLAALYEHIYGGQMTTDGDEYVYYPSKD